MHSTLSSDVVSEKLHRSIVSRHLTFPTLTLFVLSSTKKDMLNIKGITEAKAEKCYEIAQKIESRGFETGM